MEKMKAMLDDYLAAYPTEKDELSALYAQATVSTDPELVDRRNFVGHATASGFVFSRCRTRVLLLEHKTLGRYLQPGGHIEGGDESPLEAALREVREETGLERIELLSINGRDDLPFHINTHPIPANPRKNELSHFHHDFSYLFVCKDDLDVISIKTEGPQNFTWVDVDEFLEMKAFSIFAEKIRTALGKSSCANVR